MSLSRPKSGAPPTMHSSTTQQVTPAGRFRLRTAVVGAIVMSILGASVTVNVEEASAQFVIQGSIRAEYDYVNQNGGFIGAPTDIERDADGGGKFQNFQSNNHIYWHPRIDTAQGRQIGGSIFDKWATVNWEKSALGYPTSREFQAGRGGSG